LAKKAAWTLFWKLDHRNAFVIPFENQLAKMLFVIYYLKKNICLIFLHPMENNWDVRNVKTSTEKLP